MHARFMVTQTFISLTHSGAWAPLVWLIPSSVGMQDGGSRARGAGLRTWLTTLRDI